VGTNPPAAFLFRETSEQTTAPAGGGFAHCRELLVALDRLVDTRHAAKGESDCGRRLPLRRAANFLVRSRNEVHERALSWQPAAHFPLPVLGR
jgi:hypothetical protein